MKFLGLLLLAGTSAAAASGLFTLAFNLTFGALSCWLVADDDDPEQDAEEQWDDAEAGEE